MQSVCVGFGQALRAKHIYYKKACTVKLICLPSEFYQLHLSTDAKDRTNEVLKYNQDFRLECIANIDPSENKSLFVYSSPKTVSICNVAKSAYNFYKNGEINQSVGVCYQSLLPNCASEIPTIHCNWKCLNRVPNLRYETEGDPVPVSNYL